ncbi:fatty acid coa synthetase family [Anaeramoeba flamelloides]|uniref:Fatty acid coa synthetase family n=1 Tax=Anaeramoeba flamelloides TaxID=1746091 RepID=A0ABQ8Z6E4_9EUKA|nr:fatty acid coa synthetase family [Anaeramoeba flamelloides]
MSQTIVCSSCSKGDLTNTKHFRSVESPKYVLCEECFETEEHEHEMFIDEMEDCQHQEILRSHFSDSIGENYKRVFERYWSRPCIGEFDSEHKLAYLSYLEIYYRSLLVAEKLYPYIKDQIQPGSTTFVFVSSPNCVEWVFVEYGCSFLGLVLVPVHHSSNIAKIKNLLSQTYPSIIIASSEIVGKFEKAIKEYNEALVDKKEKEKKQEEKRIPTPTILVINKTDFGKIPQEKLSKFTKQLTQGNKESKGKGKSKNRLFLDPNSAKTKFMFKEIETLSQKYIIKRSDEEIFTITFTSGSTGNPKGVFFTNSVWKNRCLKFYKSGFPIVAFFWSSFVESLERVGLIRLLYSGGRIALSSGINYMLEELAISRPTGFTATPRIFDMVYSQYHFDFEMGMKKIGKGDHNKVKELQERLRKEYSKRFGDRLQFLATTGAPINKKTFAFLKETYPCKILDSFGSTEAGSLFINNAIIDPSVEVKLIDCVPLGYYAPNYGEICVKTSEMFSGYWKNEKANKESFTKDGYYRTGDIGQLVLNEKTKKQEIIMIDRIKSICKLSQGVYITPNYLEGVFEKSLLIDQIYVDVSSKYSFLVAVVVLNRKYIDENSIEISERMILNELIEIGKLNKLESFEVPKAIYIERNIKFSIENEMLTVTGKLKRLQCKKRYKAEIETLYDQIEDEISQSTEDKNGAFEDQESGNKSIDQIIQKILNCKELIKTKSCYELGGDSITLLNIGSYLKKHYNIHVPNHLLYSPIKELIQFVENKLSNKKDQTNIDQGEVNYKDDLIFPSKFNVLMNSQPIYPNIFLTGSTGFLGIHLLYQLLLIKSVQNIYCLVRSKGVDDGKQRLWNRFLNNFVNLQENDHNNNLKQAEILFNTKVKIIPGSLEKEKFGMDNDSFTKLANELNLIFHIGANVNMMYPYSILKGPNVDGTKTIIELSLTNQVLKGKIPIHYTSTISVIPKDHPDIENFMEDSDPLTVEPKLTTGYGQTKWVSEALLEKAKKEYNLQILIWRVSSIFCSTKTGFLNNRDFLFIILHGFIYMKSVPKYLLQNQWDLLPVDTCAQIMTYLAFNKPKECFKQKCLHLANPYKLKFHEIIDGLNEGNDFGIKELEFSKFRSALDNSLNTKNPLKAVHTYFQYDKNNVVKRKTRHLDTTKLINLLDNKVKIPKIDKMVMDKYASYIKYYLSNLEK